MTAAQNLDAPGPLRDENQHMIEALQLRVSGVQGLADTFAANPDVEGDGRGGACSPRRPTGCSRATSSGTTCSRRRRAAELKRQGVSGVVGARLELRRQPRPDDGALDGAAPDAAEGRDDGRHADGHPRHEHRRRQGAAGRPDAVADDREHDHRDHRPRVRRHDRRLGRLAGGRDQGDADDPEAAGRDRQDARPST